MTDWTAADKKVARVQYDKALAAAQKECMNFVRSHPVESIQDVWKLEDGIREWGKEIADLFEYRYSRLDLTFCIFVRRGWLTWEDIAGFSEERLKWMHDVTKL